MHRSSRIVSFLLVIFSYLLAWVTRRAIHMGGPAAISFEPTNRCNLRCSECPTGNGRLTRPSGKADPALFRAVIDAVQPTVSYLTLYFQGEPMLHPEFSDMVAYARQRGIFVATSTNGHFLDRVTARSLVASGLNRLIISVDGSDQSSYASYREGGNLMKVIEGIRTILNARKEAGSRHPQVILQCLYLKSNEHQHDAMKVMGRDLGVDRIEFKKAQFYDFDRGHPLMPERNAHRRYARLPGTPVQYRIKNPRFNSCFRMWSSCVVTWDGKVLPCCFDKDGTWVMGDLSKESFNEIWHGKKYDEFRRGIIKNRKGIAMCNNCTSVI